MSIQQNGDERLVALFKHLAVKNETKTKEEGRPIYDDQEIVEIRMPGSKNVFVFPATAVSHWSGDEYGGDQFRVTYAERFARQYQQFKAQQAQTKSGTPLAIVTFLTEGKRAELRAQNIYTIEQLAGVDGNELKNLGPFGRELKNKAEEYITEGKMNAPNLQMASELEAMRAKNAILEEDMALLKKQAVEKAENADAEYDNMTLDELRALVLENTGHPPQGTPNRKTLIRMIRNSQTKAA